MQRICLGVVLLATACGGSKSNGNQNVPVSSACPAPPQGPIGQDWPEVFVGVLGCDDQGAGTRAAPFCTFGAAFSAADSVPGIVTVLDGEYRLPDEYPDGSFRYEINRPGTATEYFVIRADDGAMPRLYGSVQFPGNGFEAVAGGLHRAAADALGRDPAGMWTADGERMNHHSGDFGDSFHVDTSELAPGEWTKADDAGTACGDDSAGCYLYLYPPAGMDVTTESFEVDQGGFISATGSDYLVVRGLTIHFTHWTPVFISGATHVLVEDNDLAHNAAQGGNNAYGLSLWSVNSALVRRNRVRDTTYWTAANAWGITFMISGEQPGGDCWVCDNELEGFSRAAVGSKGGSSKVRVIGNTIYNSGNGVEIPESRCDGPQCNVHFHGGDWTVRENLIYACDRGVEMNVVSSELQAYMDPSLVHNNVIVDVAFAIGIQLGDPLWTVRNNVFVDCHEGAIRLGGTDDVGDLVGAVLDSDYNFFTSGPAYVHYANWAVQGTWTRAEAQSDLALEAHSLDGDPLLDPTDGYRPQSGSPTLGSGDSSIYPDTSGPVNMGRFND